MADVVAVVEGSVDKDTVAGVGDAVPWVLSVAGGEATGDEMYVSAAGGDAADVCVVAVAGGVATVCMVLPVCITAVVDGVTAAGVVLLSAAGGVTADMDVYTATAAGGGATVVAVTAAGGGAAGSDVRTLTTTDGGAAVNVVLLSAVDGVSALEAASVRVGGATDVSAAELADVNWQFAQVYSMSLPVSTASLYCVRLMVSVHLMCVHLWHVSQSTALLVFITPL